MSIEVKDATEIIPTEIQEEIKREVATIITGCCSIERIDNQNQYENAVTLAREIKRIAKRVEDQRTATVKPLNTIVKNVNDYFRDPLDRLGDAEKNLKTVLSAYQAEQEKKRLEEQRKAEEAARKERERIEAEARAQREREEANRRAEEDARRRAAEAQNAEDRARAEREAEAARKRAEDAAAKAEVKEQVAELVVTPVIQIAPKAKGISTATVYSAEVYDLAAFMAWGLKTGQLVFFSVDQRALDRIMSATKGAMQMDGVRCKTTEQMRMRAAA